MNILVLNPGGNSLKIDIVACGPNQRHAFEAAKLISVTIEGIGRNPELSRLEGKKSVHSESIEAWDYASATERFLNWYERARVDLPNLKQINRVGVRVVHGGSEFALPTPIDQAVEKKIKEFEKLAPLHNKSSIKVLAPLRRRLPNVPIYGVFDTAYHRTIPEYASRYAPSGPGGQASDSALRISRYLSSLPARTLCSSRGQDARCMQCRIAAP